VATRNHKAKSAIKVPKGIAAELEFIQSTKFKIKNSANTNLNLEAFI
jgi:hypothetical protein